MLPEETIRSIIHSYPVAHLSEGIQDFYNGPCAAVDIADLDHGSEIMQLLTGLIEYHSVELE